MNQLKRILPAYPIFLKDPNFSLWSTSERLNAGNLQTWWGEEKRIYGFLKTHGKTYCFLGNGADFSASQEYILDAQGVRRVDRGVFN